MKKQHMELFRSLLLKERINKINSLNTEKIGLGSSIKDDTGELSSYDNHPGDLGTETFEAEKNYSFRNNYKTIIELIDIAIKKIDDENYGLCEICNKDIDRNRLKLIPYTRFCIECEKNIIINYLKKKKEDRLKKKLLLHHLEDLFGIML